MPKACSQALTHMAKSASRGGRGQASLYRLAFIDEVLIELRDNALLFRLQALDNLQPDLLQVSDPEKPAAAAAASLSPETCSTDAAETCSTFDPKPAAAAAAHRTSHISKDRSDGASQKRDDDGRAREQAKAQLRADPRVTWLNDSEPQGLEPDDSPDDDPLPDESEAPIDDDEDLAEAAYSAGIVAGPASAWRA